MNRHPMKILGSIFLLVAAVAALGAGLTFLPFSGLVPYRGAAAVNGLIFGVIGAGCWLYAHIREKRRERLMAGGCCETATVLQVKQSPYIRINRRHPWYVVCRLARGGTVRECRSDLMMQRPALQPGDAVPVYLDRQNERAYYVDVSPCGTDFSRRG